MIHRVENDTHDPLINIDYDGLSYEIVDFTVDNSMIRTTSGAYELLFFRNANTGEKIQKDIGGGASATVTNVWENNHAKFGWRVDGIYPEGTDGTYVNSVELSKDEN